MHFEFATATRIVFGSGTLTQLGAAAVGFGTRALVVTGRNAQRAAPLFAILGAHGIATASYAIPAEPTIQLVNDGVTLARTSGCQMVISMGGGSVIDGGKAIAALSTNPGAPLDYLEVIGAGKPLLAPPLPFIAIPTTAGTGAEVTRNAVLASPEHQLKVSLRSPLMLPDLALVDPDLSHDMPPALTAATGMDALTQLIEPFVSHFANPVTDGFCREGIRRAARALRRSVQQGDDADARTGMALASLLGGLALANARLGAVHGFAAPLGGLYPAPHGAVCGRLLPFATAVNIQALTARTPQHPSLQRYVEVAKLLTGDPNARAHDGVAWLTELGAELKLPGLATYGVQEAHLADIVAKATRASSMRGNPIELTEAELHTILRRAL